MWQCPKCETKNNESICVVCGEKMPSGQKTNISKPQPMSDVQSNIKNTSPTTSEFHHTKKKTPLLKISIILLSVLLIGMVVFAVIYFIDSSSTDRTSSPQTANTTAQQNSTTSQQNTTLATDTTPDINQQPQDTTDENSQSKDTPDSVVYGEYENSIFGFSCAYPAHFERNYNTYNNVVAKYISPDKSATMTLCASVRPDDFNIDNALSDFHKAFSGDIAYQANGTTWYAISLEMGDRILYRKFIMNEDYLYCMDFEHNREDLDIYTPQIEYIEDNFIIN